MPFSQPLSLSGSSPPWFSTWGNFADINPHSNDRRRSPATVRERWRNAASKVSKNPSSTFAGFVTEVADRKVFKVRREASNYDDDDEEEFEEEGEDLVSEEDELHLL